MGHHGLRHIDREYHTNVVWEDNEWWYRQPSDGRRRRLSAHIRKNKKRMWVNGGYVNTGNILHIPGNYESFEDAAFTNLCKKEKRMEGHVYLLYSKSVPNWFKVGRAYNLDDRLAAYQTSSPFRDYEILDSFFTEDCRYDEYMAHDVFGAVAISKNGEWFELPSADDALSIFEEVQKLCVT